MILQACQRSRTVLIFTTLKLICELKIRAALKEYKICNRLMFCTMSARVTSDLDEVSQYNIYSVQYLFEKKKKRHFSQWKTNKASWCKKVWERKEEKRNIFSLFWGQIEPLEMFSFFLRTFLRNLESFLQVELLIRKFRYFLRILDAL